MIGVSIGFSLGGLLLLTMGFLIRYRGMTWLIAGYDRNLVRDEKGLAKWFGSGFMILGAIGILAGILSAVLPPDYTIIPVILFAVSIPAGVIRILTGLHQYVK